jgi:hypothetical protein
MRVKVLLLGRPGPAGGCASPTVKLNQPPLDVDLGELPNTGCRWRGAPV